jgi:dipeptidyl aminopeptidase/acylaminoacyl peptidase
MSRSREGRRGLTASGKIAGALVLLPGIALAQPELEMQRLIAPRFLQLSPDGSRLRYKLGAQWWEVSTTPNSRPKRTAHGAAPEAAAAMTATRRSRDEKSPDGKRVAYLGVERPYGPVLLFSATLEEGAAAKPVSRMPVIAFHWAADSRSLWVIGIDGADEPVGRLHLDGRFATVSDGCAMRRLGGLSVVNDTLAWVQCDGKHFGAIWVRDRSGGLRVLMEPNPEAVKWNPGTQEVVRWRNAHGEELVGILAKPSTGGHFPLIVDPYSGWRNRYLNIAVLGNYMFVQEGFAVFFPDHRAAHAFPENSFGEAYVGASRNRDPVEVLTDDVMSGVDELVRRGIAEPDHLFLYSSSTGASAIDQLLTQTHAFRAAVAHGGVADWLGHYRMRHPLGNETIPGFLGGRTPSDSLELYRRISPIYHAGQVKTPLMLVVGDKDETRYSDNLSFHEALLKAGCPAKLVVYKGEGHEISNAELGVKHVRQAIDFFRSAPPPAK